MPEPSVVHDPQVLRAIAHPLRNRILAELSAQGSMRAADIARELDVPANQASFHLRQLAKYGLVAEDPDAARDKRDRVWKRAHEHGMTIELKALRAAPGGAAAVEVFRRERAAFAHQVIDRAWSGEHQEGVSTTVNETSVRLTKAEAQELGRAVGELFDTFVSRTRGLEDGQERRTYWCLGAVTVHPEPGR